MTNKDFDQIHKKIISLGPSIIKKVTMAIKKELGIGGTLSDYKVVWNELQEIAAPQIESILSKSFPDCKITITESKSTYPDVRMEYKKFVIAIDIKSSESAKDPWYDIARLDTIIKNRINKYDEEYELVVKYDSRTKKFIKIFFETLRDTVGFNPKSGGVKFRPYDGKLRPKTWKEFDSGKTYWSTKKRFLEGVEKSRKYRWKELLRGFSKEELGEFLD